MHHKPYLRLFGMTILSFLSMYMLMYAMVDAFANVYSNFNQFYMAGLMASAMVIIELALMGSMYHEKKWNALIMGASCLALVAFFLLIRQQAGISDKQFVRSMIPHHASALLMCRKAPIQDAEIKKLCQNIQASQQSEIDQMKAIMKRLEKGDSALRL